MAVTQKKKVLEDLKKCYISFPKVLVRGVLLDVPERVKKIAEKHNKNA